MFLDAVSLAKMALQWGWWYWQVLVTDYMWEVEKEHETKMHRAHCHSKLSLWVTGFCTIVKNIKLKQKFLNPKNFVPRILLRVYVYSSFLLSSFLFFEMEEEREKELVDSVDAIWRKPNTILLVRKMKKTGNI